MFNSINSSYITPLLQHILNTAVPSLYHPTLHFSIAIDVILTYRVSSNRLTNAICSIPSIHPISRPYYSTSWQYSRYFSLPSHPPLLHCNRCHFNVPQNIVLQRRIATPCRSSQRHFLEQDRSNVTKVTRT